MESNDETSLTIDDTIKQENNEILDKLAHSKDVEATKDFTNLFNMNIIKTKAGQINKNNQLIDLVQSQALQRFKNNPNALSNKDLLDYLNVLSSMNDKLSNSMEQINSQPLIQINKQTNEVNINNQVIPGLETKEARDNLVSVIDQLLNLTKTDSIEEADIIDMDKDKE